MNEFGFPILTVITFLPMVGVILVLLTDKENHGVIRGIALTTTLIEFLVSLPLFLKFDLSTHEMQFVEKIPWIPDLGIQYHMGIDGISLLLVLLTTFLTPICVLASWRDIKDKVKEFIICLLFLETGMIGVFVSLDLFLFYVFWEVMLIPMYLLIGVWGNPLRRVYAALKFFIYTMAGSVLMLVAILVLYFWGPHMSNAIDKPTFDLLKLYTVNIPAYKQTWLFLAFAVAFAIKVPLFPLHTWLPDAHTEAPTVGSVLLAAVLLKMGTYGFMRFCLPLFPNAAIQFVPLFSALAIIGIIYGAMVSLVQKDLKRLVAFSSVSHLGFVVLGIFAMTTEAAEGSIIQMINHGLSTGALFLIVGIIYERRHTRLIEDFGGLSRVMPAYSAIFMIVMLSSIGLPGLNGFVGEFLILLGTFKVNKLYAVLAATGVILAACYMLWMYQRVIFGEVTNPKNKVLKDLTVREWFVLVPVVIFIIWIGVMPRVFLRTMDASVEHLLSHVKTKAQVVQQLDMERAAKSRVVLR